MHAICCRVQYLRNVVITIKQRNSSDNWHLMTSGGFGFRLGCKDNFMHGIFTIVDFGILVRVLPEHVIAAT
jgi:hypothetical protein